MLRVSFYVRKENIIMSEYHLLSKIFTLVEEREMVVVIEGEGGGGGRRKEG